jgi:hypothetical protein
MGGAAAGIGGPGIGGPGIGGAAEGIGGAAAGVGGAIGGVVPIFTVGIVAWNPSRKPKGM